VNITSRPILPGIFQFSEGVQGHCIRHFTLTGPIAKYSDTDLLNYCGYSPELGGYVVRGFGVAHVAVHTD
jgi:hypothetical protein